MGFKHTISGNGLYFLTFTVIDWVDVFTRRDYKDILVNSIQYCQINKGLGLYAWVIMPNHVHLIASASGKPGLSDIFRDLKKFTSKALVDAIKTGNESRKAWMLDRLSFKAMINPKIQDYQFWKEGIHPVELTTNEFMEQKLDYVHQNPVKMGFVEKPEVYVYSSAIDYAGGKGLLEVILIE